MRIFKCVIGDDEMFADSFKLAESEDGIFYEVEGKICTRTEGIDGALIGANDSSEVACEGTDETSVTGVDIIINHGLQRTVFDKKSFLTYIKEYVKSLKSHLEKNNPERVEEFVKNSPAAVKRVIADFSNFEFFTGPSMNVEGIVGMLNYRPDGVTPYMLFFKDGVIGEKC